MDNRKLLNTTSEQSGLVRGLKALESVNPHTAMTMINPTQSEKVDLASNSHSSGLQVSKLKSLKDTYENFESKQTSQQTNAKIIEELCKQEQRRAFWSVGRSKPVLGQVLRPLPTRPIKQSEQRHLDKLKKIKQHMQVGGATIEPQSPESLLSSTFDARFDNKPVNIVQPPNMEDQIQQIIRIQFNKSKTPVLPQNYEFQPDTYLKTKRDIIGKKFKSFRASPSPRGVTPDYQDSTGSKMSPRERLAMGIVITNKAGTVEQKEMRTQQPTGDAKPSYRTTMIDTERDPEGNEIILSTVQEDGGKVSQEIQVDESQRHSDNRQVERADTNMKQVATDMSPKIRTTTQIEVRPFQQLQLKAVEQEKKRRETEVRDDTPNLRDRLKLQEFGLRLAMMKQKQDSQNQSLPNMSKGTGGRATYFQSGGSLSSRVAKEQKEDMKTLHDDLNTPPPPAQALSSAGRVSPTIVLHDNIQFQNRKNTQNMYDQYSLMNTHSNSGQTTKVVTPAVTTKQIFNVPPIRKKPVFPAGWNQSNAFLKQKMQKTMVNKNPQNSSITYPSDESITKKMRSPNSPDHDKSADNQQLNQIASGAKDIMSPHDQSTLHSRTHQVSEQLIKDGDARRTTIQTKKHLVSIDQSDLDTPIDKILEVPKVGHQTVVVDMPSEMYQDDQHFEQKYDKNDTEQDQFNQVPTISVNKNNPNFSLTMIEMSKQNETISEELSRERLNFDTVKTNVFPMGQESDDDSVGKAPGSFRLSVKNLNPYRFQSSTRRSQETNRDSTKIINQNQKIQNSIDKAISKMKKSIAEDNKSQSSQESQKTQNNQVKIKQYQLPLGLLPQDQSYIEAVKNIKSAINQTTLPAINNPPKSASMRGRKLKQTDRNKRMYTTVQTSKTRQVGTALQQTRMTPLVIATEATANHQDSVFDSHDEDRQTTQEDGSQTTQRDLQTPMTLGAGDVLSEIRNQHIIDDGIQQFMSAKKQSQMMQEIQKKSDTNFLLKRMYMPNAPLRNKHRRAVSTINEGKRIPFHLNLTKAPLTNERISNLDSRVDFVGSHQLTTAEQQRFIKIKGKPDHMFMRQKTPGPIYIGSSTTLPSVRRNPAILPESIAISMINKGSGKPILIQGRGSQSPMEDGSTDSKESFMKQVAKMWQIVPNSVKNADGQSSKGTQQAPQNQQVAGIIVVKKEASPELKTLQEKEELEKQEKNKVKEVSSKRPTTNNSMTASEINAYAPKMMKIKRNVLGATKYSQQQSPRLKELRVRSRLNQSRGQSGSDSKSLLLHSMLKTDTQHSELQTQEKSNTRQNVDLKSVGLTKSPGVGVAQTDFEDMQIQITGEKLPQTQDNTSPTVLAIRKISSQDYIEESTQEKKKPGTRSPSKTDLIDSRNLNQGFKLKPNTRVSPRREKFPLNLSKITPQLHQVTIGDSKKPIILSSERQRNSNSYADQPSPEVQSPMGHDDSFVVKNPMRNLNRDISPGSSEAGGMRSPEFVKEMQHRVIQPKNYDLGTQRMNSSAFSNWNYELQSVNRENPWQRDLDLNPNPSTKMKKHQGFWKQLSQQKKRVHEVNVKPMRKATSPLTQTSTLKNYIDDLVKEYGNQGVLPESLKALKAFPQRINYKFVEKTTSDQIKMDQPSGIIVQGNQLNKCSIGTIVESQELTAPEEVILSNESILEMMKGFQQYFQEGSGYAGSTDGEHSQSGLREVVPLKKRLSDTAKIMELIQTHRDDASEPEAAVSLTRKLSREMI